MPPTLDESLYQTLLRMAHRVARGLDPEEVAQATALRMIRGRLLARWQADRGEIDAYLYVITRSVAVSMRRTAHRRGAGQPKYSSAVLLAEADRRRAWLRDTLASRHTTEWWRDVEARLSPDAARVLQALLSGETRVEVRRTMSKNREHRLFTEIVRSVEAQCRH